MKPIQHSFDGNWFIRAYNSLFSGTDKLNTDESIDIALDYKNSYALYAFDLITDLGEDDHFNLVRHGNLHLSLKFNAELPETVTILAYTEFNNVIELDRNRNVLVDCEATIARYTGHNHIKSDCGSFTLFLGFCNENWFYLLTNAYENTNFNY